MSSYVLVTPVRNEAATIGRTIGSVLGQTQLPREWVIVSDGSTDGTDEIVEAAAMTHSWIRLLPVPSCRESRCFAAVVRNTETGIGALRCREYDFIGLLDADVAFAATYFEELMRRFKAAPGLGIAGGVVIDVGRRRDRLPRNRLDVPGAVQFFRRDCFERLGGLFAIPEGGWDGVACATARMKGFQTRLFTDLVVDHLKPRNVSQGGTLRRIWQMGRRDYAVGYHPVFEVLKCIGRIAERPYILASLARLFGYCSARLERRSRVVSAELVRHLRQEQRQTLQSLLGL